MTIGVVSVSPQQVAKQWYARGQPSISDVAVAAAAGAIFLSGRETLRN